MSRRSNGSGKPRLKANGKYEYRVRVKKADGSWGEKSFSASTAQEARRRGDEWKRLTEQGYDPDGGDMTLAEYLPLWLNRHQVRHKRRLGRELGIGTLQNYQRASKQVIKAAGKSKLRNCSARVLEEAIFADGATPHTAEKRHLVLSVAFKAAVVDGLMDHNPMVRVEHPFVPQSKEGIFFEKWERDEIFEAARGTRWEFALQIHLALGVRISELLALRESDIDYVNNKVSINKSTNFLRGHYGETKPTKNYETRIIDVSADTLDLFRKQKDLRTFRYGLDYKPAIWEQDEDQLIFPNAVSGLWNPRRYAHELHKEVYSKTSITRPDRKTLGTHCWRHTAGAILVSAGVPLKTVSVFLGHKSSAITERVYAHLLAESKTEVADILTEALAG